MRIHYLLVATALLSCAGSTEPSPPPGAVRILILGNSLTYTNDLPRMVETIAKAGGDTFYVRGMAHPDWGLQDHWDGEAAPHEIAADKWDVIVLQQGPSSMEESRVALLYWSRKFGDLAHLHDACPAMYMVWPPSGSSATIFDAVRDHYAEAADSIGGLFLPAGEAWRNAWATDPSYPFYGADGFHPTPLGTYLAALTIYSGLTGRSPIGNPATPAGVSITAQQRLELQQAAWAAAYGQPRRCEI